MIMPNRATVLLILLLKKWIFCKQVVGKRNWNVTLCIKRNSFCVILGTLSIDNEMHDDEVRNPSRIGSRVSFSAGKTKVKQCVVLRQRPLCIEKPRLSVRFVRTFWPERVWWVWEFRRVSFWKTRYSNSEGSFGNPKHDYLQSALCLWWEGLYMLLKRLSYPCRYRDMIHRFAKPVPVLSMITNQTIDYVYNVHGNRVLNWNHEVLSPVNLQT